MKYCPALTMLIPFPSRFIRRGAGQGSKIQASPHRQPKKARCGIFLQFSNPLQVGHRRSHAEPLAAKSKAFLTQLLIFSEIIFYKDTLKRVHQFFQVKFVSNIQKSAVKKNKSPISISMKDHVAIQYLCQIITAYKQQCHLYSQLK